MQISILCGCLVGAWVYFWLFILVFAPLQASVWPLLSFTAVFVKALHLFSLQRKKWSAGWKSFMKIVNFMVMNRIITGCMQLLNSPWTFGLSIRKMLAIKPADLHSFFFPLLFSQPLARTFCTVQVSLPIWTLQEDESDHWNPTLLSSSQGWNGISAAEWCSWQLTTFLQRSSLQPDSW